MPRTITAQMFLAAAFVGSMAAQSPENPKEAAGQPQSAKAVSAYSDEPIVYEYVRGTMRYENDGTGSLEIRGRIRVNTAAGLARAGQLVFGYNAANEKLEVRSVEVTKTDGSIYAAGPDAVQDLSSPVARQAPMYTDARQKHVTVPGVAVGDKVDYDVITTTFLPLMPGQFWQTWNFMDDAICLEELVDLNVPRKRPLKLKSPPGIEPTVREDGDRRIYHWATSTLRHPDGADIFKNFKFDIPTLLQGVRPPAKRQIIFSSFQSWEEVGQWYAQLESDRRIPTPEIRAQAASIVQGKTTDLAKVEALYEWVARNVRYVSLSFGVGRYQPHTAAEVLANRYGDCKDKTTLLEAFLEAEGLRGQAVLIHSRRDLDPDVPTPHQFDHAITFVKVAGQDLWLDSTLGVGPFGYLLPQLRGKDALVVFTDSAAGLHKTPPELPMATLYNVELKGAVDEKRMLEGSLSLETRGDLEVLLRLAFLTLSPAQLTAIIDKARTESKAKSSDEFSISDLKAGDPTDLSKLFRVDAYVRFKQGASPQSVLDSLVSMGPSSTDPVLSLLPALDKGKVALGGPKEYSLHMVFTYPLGTAANLKPVHVHISKDFAEYESNMVWEGVTLQSEWRLNLRVPEVPVNRSAEYIAFAKEVSDSLGGATSKAATLKRPGSLTLSPSPPKPPAHVPPSGAEELYKQGLAEIKGGNWGNAERLMQQVVDLDPNFDSAWNNLGQAHIYLRKYAQGETAFRKLLELQPDDALPYAQLAWALTLEKKYAEAAELLEKRIASAPKDGDAHRRLGLAYLLMHRAEPAVSALQKAASLLPDNDSVHFYLGQACLQAHRNDEAASAFERSIAIKGTDIKLNDAAYELSKEKTHLDLAESWSKSALSEVETELNQVTLQTAQTNTSTLLRKAAMYWDTLGWIKFQKNDLPAAERYVRAGWELADDTTIGAHLARIHEAEGRKSEAIEVYAQTLLAVPTNREMTDDEKEARKRLAALLGGESLVDARMNESRSRARDRRSIQISNAGGAEGIVEYMVMLGPGAKLTDLQAVNSENQFDKLAATLRGAAMPQSFPDATILKLPRGGILACARSDQPCKFTLMSAGASARSFSFAAAPGSDR